LMHRGSIVRYISQVVFSTHISVVGHHELPYNDDMRLKGKDILLAFLYAKGDTGQFCEPVLGATRLSKAIFLFEEEIKPKFTEDSIDELPEFMAWNYGPWSKQLMDDVDFFVNLNFVKQETVQALDDVSLAEQEEYKKWEEEVGPVDEDKKEDTYAQQKYSLTEVGKRYVEAKIWSNFSSDQQNLMNDFKKKINTISLFALLRYVYRTYSKEGSDWTRNSVIKDKIFQK